MNIVFLLLGSNLGQREYYIVSAIKKIETEIGKVLSASPILHTKPWGIINQPDYLNQCVKVETQFDAFQVLGQCQIIENHIGRIRKKKWGPRHIDIDILFFNEDIINTEMLQIPHPYFLKRHFAIELMNTIEPDFVYPKTHKTIQSFYLDTLKPIV